LSFDEASTILVKSCVQPSRILDVGTGRGTAAFKALKLLDGRGQIIGLDISTTALREARLRRAREGMPPVEFLRGCGERLPFQDQTFDVVISSFGLAHFRDPSTALREMIRVLKARGRIGIADFRHPTYVEVHPVFRSANLKMIINWISERLRAYGCRGVRVVYSRRDFFVVTAVKGDT